MYTRRASIFAGDFWKADTTSHEGLIRVYVHRVGRVFFFLLFFIIIFRSASYRESFPSTPQPACLQVGITSVRRTAYRHHLSLSTRGP